MSAPPPVHERTIKSVADVLRLPVGTRLRIVRSLLGPCRKLRTVLETHSREVVMRVDDPADKYYGEKSYLTFPKGSRVEPRVGGFAVIDDGEVAAEYQFLHPAEVTCDRTYCNDGATKEPWDLASFAEANAQDPDLDNMISAIRALAVGGTCTFGGGAVAVTVVTRLT